MSVGPESLMAFADPQGRQQVRPARRAGLGIGHHRHFANYATAWEVLRDPSSGDRRLSTTHPDSRSLFMSGNRANSARSLPGHGERRWMTCLGCARDPPSTKEGQ